MNMLSIETSCDETGISILECNGGLDNPQFQIRGNALYSQIKEHEEYGGVYPNIAKREHSRNLLPLLQEAMKETDCRNTKQQITSGAWKQAEEILHRQPELFKKLRNLLKNEPIPAIDAVAVTHGPGLEPALWVGLNFAKALSILWDIPLVPVNHLEAHMLTPFINRSSLPFPAVSLIVSGGHTQLIYAEDYFDYQLLGQTQDDAVGEAFDKVARMLDLGYPGGPEIARLAHQARENSKFEIRNSNIDLPRPMIDSGDYNFSFSGLKTAVLYTIRDIKEEKNIETLDKDTKAAIAKEFEDAVADVLVTKTKHALEEYTPASLILGGGVIANEKIRNDFKDMLADWPDVELLLPRPDLATDNAVMIGIAGYLRYTHGDIIKDKDTIESIEADGRLAL